jgi:hypothetical protein
LPLAVCTFAADIGFTLQEADRNLVQVSGRNSPNNRGKSDPGNLAILISEIDLKGYATTFFQNVVKEEPCSLFAVVMKPASSKYPFSPSPGRENCHWAINPKTRELAFLMSHRPASRKFGGIRSHTLKLETAMLTLTLVPQAPTIPLQGEIWVGSMLQRVTPTSDRQSSPMSFFLLPDSTLGVSKLVHSKTH